MRQICGQSEEGPEIPKAGTGYLASWRDDRTVTVSPLEALQSNQCSWSKLLSVLQGKRCFVFDSVMHFGSCPVPFCSRKKARRSVSFAWSVSGKSAEPGPAAKPLTAHPNSQA